MRAQFSIDDLVVQLQWHPDWLRCFADDVIRFCGFRETSPLCLHPTFSLKLVDAGGSKLPLPRGERVTQLDGVVVWQHGSIRYFTTDQLHLELHLDTGTGVLWIDASSPRDAQLLRADAFCLLYLSLVLLLRRHGRYALHAAAVTRDDAALLFVAPSDCGKSTLSYSLVRAGWDYLSDDTVLLHASGEETRVSGFRKNFALDLEAQDLFPELRAPMGRVLSEETKLCLPMAQLHPTREARTSRPHVLIFPEIVDRPTSLLQPIDRTEAMWRTLDQSALLNLGMDDASSHVAAICRLVTQTRAYRLLAGRNLKQHPAALLDLLTPALSGLPSAAAA